MKMMTASSLIGCLILMANLPPVSGLCSTCLEERCYDNGECIIGCVPGFVGKYCNEACPPRCLNKACYFDRIDGSVTCTDGCEPGYCGIQCGEPCPGDCVTCNRQCGLCNVNVCPKRRFGPDCSLVCSARYEKCDRENGQCIKCRRGYYGNECNLECPTCFTQAENMFDKCLSGCDICTSKGFNTILATVVPIIILVCLVAGIATIPVIWRRRQSRRYSRRDEESLEIQETLIPADLNEKAKKQTIDLWKKTKMKIESLTSGMINTSAVDTVVDMLQSGGNWVTITGNAGDGKTILGYLVLKEIQNKPHRQRTLGGKINVYSIEEPEECALLLRLNENSVIMLDDIFGAFTSDLILIDKWKNVMNDIHQRFLDHGNQIKVIFISRKNVVNEAREYLGHFRDTILRPENVVDLSSLKIKGERLEILDYYLTQSKLKVSSEVKHRVADIDIAQGFPLCSMMYPKLKAKKSDLDIQEFFKTPLKFLDITTAVLYTENCKGLFELMIKNNGEFDAYSVKDDERRASLLKVELEQEGSYITVSENGVCVFAHPSIYESVLSVICDTDSLFCVKYATLSVIRQKLTLTSDEKQKSPTQIHVKPVQSVLKTLAERFRQDILQGDYTVFGLRFCDNENFCQELVASCVYSGTAAPEQDLDIHVLTDTFTEKTGSKQFINQPGKNGQTMLWTALRNGRRSAVHLLVKAGACVNTQDDRERTPLHHLSQFNYSTDAFREEIKGDGIHNPADLETMRLIINEGRGDVNICDQYRQTPLHYVCQVRISDSAADGHYNDKLKDVVTNAMRLIITEGRGNVNLSDRYGQTPLHYLFKSCYFTTEEIQLIIAQGKGDLNKCEQHKSTPLHYLCANSSLQLDTVDLVVKEGKGDFNKGDEHGTTPFHYLCENGKLERDVVLRIVNTAKGDINMQDGNGVTPLHVLCSGSLPMENVLLFINQGDKTDMYGNTPLHYLCRRRGINAEVLQQQLERHSETDREKQNDLGYTPFDYLTDKDDSLPWTDGTIARSAADLVMCRLKLGDNRIVVLGRAMILNSERVHELLQVEDFGRVLTNMDESRRRNTPDQFSWFRGTCSSPVLVPHSPSTLTTPPSYWETISTLTRRERGWIPLLEMGVVVGRRNMDKELCVSALPSSVCVSVWDLCPHHSDRLCIRVWRGDHKDRRHQVGECVTLSLPPPGVEFTLTFGLVLDVGRGRVGFIDVVRGELLCKVDMEFKEWVFPMFFVNPDNDCTTMMRLVSGRDIYVTNKKIQLIQQALSD